MLGARRYGLAVESRDGLGGGGEEAGGGQGEEVEECAAVDE